MRRGGAGVAQCCAGIRPEIGVIGKLYGGLALSTEAQSAKAPIYVCYSSWFLLCSRASGVQAVRESS